MSLTYQSWTEYPVNLADPVNRQHPLNYGRVAWYLALPGWYGGPYWYDLMGRYHGTLAGAEVWSPQRRPGGHATLFNSSTGYVSMGSNAAFQPTTTVTMAAWAIMAATSAYTPLATQTWSSTHTAPYHSYKLGANYGGVATWNCEVRGTNCIGSSYTVGVPARVLMIFDNTNLTLYINGRQDAQVAGTGNLTYDSGSKFVVGANADGSENMGGYIDDVSVWNRALSVAEVLADYNLSWQGYPGVLNRIDAALWMVPPAVSAVVFPWAGQPEIPRRRRDPIEVIPY